MEKKVLFKTNIFICIIIILGFVVTSLISYSSNSGIFKQDVVNISTLTSDGIYRQIESIFTKPIHISMTMANDSLLKSFLTEEEIKAEDKKFIETMRNYLFAYKEKYNYDSVFLVSAKTNRYYHFDKGVDRVLNRNNSENDWYYSFLESPKEYSLNIDNDEVEAADNEITVFINCKIRGEDSEITGVVGVGFRVNYLQDIFEQYEEDFGVKAYLIDHNGRIEVSTDKTGYEMADLFSNQGFSYLKQEILLQDERSKAYWYTSSLGSGYVAVQYISYMEWFLIIDNDSSGIEVKLNRQLILNILIIILVTIMVLYVITKIVRKYNERIVKLTIEKENKHQSIFKTETEKFYENIYEIDITHNCAASEVTEQYFESLGVPKSTSYNKALSIIAQTQIKAEFREGYLAMFCTDNILKAYQNGKESLCYDFMITNDHGCTYYWMRITVRIFYWDDDRSVRIFAYWQNIDEEKNKEKGMYERMESDSLTGLYNKAATQKHIQERLKEDSGKLFAFFILDIDNFKSVNDTFGHSFGDQVIMEFASLLQSSFTSKDVLGRIGGDEFVAFAAAPSEEWIEKKAQELSCTLHHDYAEGTMRCAISASIGVSMTSGKGEDFEFLYKNADAALYVTKSNGKDGYTFKKH